MVGTYLFLAVIVLALGAFVVWLVRGLSKSSRGSRRR